ncbi:MAG: hypothetical protein ACR2QW_15970 [bacterium]
MTKYGLSALCTVSINIDRNHLQIALLEVAHSSGSNALRVESAEGVRDITITLLPFVDPDKKIPRASLRAE